LPKLDAEAGELTLFLENKGSNEARGNAEFFFLRLGEDGGGGRK